MARLAMLIDLTRCIGCDACTVACKQENGTPVDVFFARVLNIEAGKYPHTKRVYLPMLCYHCENPPCLKACPNKAIFKRQDGVVLIDQDRCRGTGACVSSCPYGNIILQEKDAWYLNEDEPYERDFVKPRLQPNVARKCTYCVQRVDEGLDPACVVACPTHARIFGDLDDPASEISTYIEQEKVQTKRYPFPLLPQAGTKPAGCYLGTMASQDSATLGGRAAPERAEPLPTRGSRSGGKLATVLALLGIGLASLVSSVQAQDHEGEMHAYESSMCASCHGPAGKGDPGPAIVPLALDKWEFAQLVREGKGAMPPTPESDLSDEDMELIFEELGAADIEIAKAPPPDELYATSSCMGCHGLSAMGGLGPPIAQTKLTEEEFHQIVRKGKGMMPATKESELSDEQVAQVYQEVKQKPWDENLIPLAFKVGQFLSTKNVAIVFLFVTLFAFVFGTKVWLYWIRLSAPKQLWSAVKKFGVLRAFGIATWSLIVDGFLVASLWRRNKMRWFLHGLILYGFVGLMLADVLIQIFNPTRAEMPLFDPLKLLPILSGVAALAGVFAVMVRYRTDEYIDNGVTQGRDFLFLNLLLNTLLSGFFVVVMKRTGLTGWVQPIYLWHLASVLLLLATAPFTRFMHVWIVPTMVALTRLCEEIVKSGVELGFSREPSPGRHHKSQRIAEDLMKTLDPNFDGPVNLRYYP